MPVWLNEHGNKLSRKLMKSHGSFVRSAYINLCQDWFRQSWSYLGVINRPDGLTRFLPDMVFMNLWKFPANYLHVDVFCTCHITIRLLAASVLAAKNNTLLLAGHLGYCGIKPSFWSLRTAGRGEAGSYGILYRLLTLFLHLQQTQTDPV